jgi:ATP-dependent DNA helicase RecG
MARVFNTSIECGQRSLVIPVHPEARAAAGDLKDNLRGDLHGADTTQVAEQVVAVVRSIDGEISRQELQAALGLANREHFRTAYLLPSLEAGLVEMTLPDKPNSRSQRYRLTTAGKALRKQQPKRRASSASTSETKSRTQNRRRK